MALKIRDTARNTRTLYNGISFLAPFLILGCVYAFFGVYPFGSKTILISDMNTQYIDFHAALYDMIKSGKSFLYSWNTDMGLNFIGIYAYYLSSPFSFLVLLFPKQNLPEAMFFITLLKVGLAGLAFSIYLGAVFRKRDITTIVFSVLYALMSFAVVYSFNIMWLDGVVFLPAVLLGVEKIIRENRFVLFCISLLILFISNFYIAYMIGLFSFLYFIAVFFSNHSVKEIKKFFLNFTYFTLSALLAAGCGAFLLLPAYFALKNGPGSLSAAPTLAWSGNFHPTDLLKMLPVGAYDTLQNGLPNIYSGLLPFVLVPLFFITSKIRWKEKLLHLALLLFMLLSFFLSNLNLIWHAFDAPNWFPYRYSFLFSFLLIYLSAKGFYRTDWSGGGRAVRIYGIGAAILLGGVIFQILRQEAPSDNLIFLTIIYVCAYTLLLCILGISFQKRRGISVVLLLIVLSETVLSTWSWVNSLDRELGYNTRTNYSQSLKAAEGLIREIQKRDEGFYRLEIAGGRTLNEPLNLDYNGLTHHSSIANHKLNRFLNKLGFANSGCNWAISYFGATPVTDSFLGIKYVLTKRERGFGYERFLTGKVLKSYENVYAMPIGFMVSEKLADMNTETDNPFELQNDMVNLALGRNNGSDGYVNYFTSLSLSEIQRNNIIMTEEKEQTYFKKIDGAKEAYVAFLVKNPKSQPVYGYVPPVVNSRAEAYLNDSYLMPYLFQYNNTILDLGYHRADEKLRFMLKLGEHQLSIAGKYFYGLDEAQFDKAMGELKKGVPESLEVGDASVRIKIEARDNQLLFTSIPFDEGWKVLVDGKKAEITKIGGAFIGIKLAKGRHDVAFYYMPQGLRAGALISGLSFMILGLLVYLFEIKRKNRLCEKP